MLNKHDLAEGHCVYQADEVLLQIPLGLRATQYAPFPLNLDHLLHRPPNVLSFFATMHFSQSPSLSPIKKQERQDSGSWSMSDSSTLMKVGRTPNQESALRSRMGMRQGPRAVRWEVRCQVLELALPPAPL